MSETPDKPLTPASDPNPEVGFALMLSRLIEAAKADPAELRSSVYQLARVKLQEQYTREDVREFTVMKQALETAIAGVETFSQKMEAIESSKARLALELASSPEAQLEAPKPADNPEPTDAASVTQPDQWPATAEAETSRRDKPAPRRWGRHKPPTQMPVAMPVVEPVEDGEFELLPDALPSARKPIRTYITPPKSKVFDNAPRRVSLGPRRMFWPLRALVVIGVLALVISAAVLVQRNRSALANLRTWLPGWETTTVTPPTTPSTNDTAQSIAERPAAETTRVQPRAPIKDPLVPTIFGIYAVSGNQLFPLEQLPGRAPDIRIAVSGLITSPSRTVLPDGKVRFVVYRRETAGPPERAEVRIVAKVRSFIAPGGKETAQKNAGETPAESWTIRNIALPFTVGPLGNDPDMYNIQPEANDLVLSPGRYVLVLRGASYDFTVSGQVTDPQQCMEKIEATNGSFYAPCRKL